MTPICLWCNNEYQVIHNGQKYCSKICSKRARNARRDAGLAGTVIPVAHPVTPAPPIIQSLKTGSLKEKDESLDLIITSERQKWPLPKLPTYDISIIELLLQGINSPLTTPSRRLRYVQAYNASYGRLTGLLKYNLDVDKYELEVRKLEAFIGTMANPDRDIIDDIQSLEKRVLAGTEWGENQEPTGANPTSDNVGGESIEGEIYSI